MRKDEERQAEAVKYADEMVRRPEFAALTMPSTPESAIKRSLVWHAAKIAFLELTE